MGKYKYLISYNFAKKEFCKESNCETIATGFGDAYTIIKGNLTQELLDEIKAEIRKRNDFSTVAISNVTRLEKIQNRRKKKC